MKFLRVLLYVLLMAVMSHAGEYADKQMDSFFKLVKKAKYKEAIAAVLDYVDIAPEQREVTGSQYAGFVKTFMTQHGKALNYTKWRTKRLSKTFDETVYQINCEKSAWMVVIREYVKADGSSAFSFFNLISEEDIFKRF